MIHMTWERFAEIRNDESGFTTAELLGNAALGIVALIAIWIALQALGVSIVNKISTDLLQHL